MPVEVILAVAKIKAQKQILRLQTHDLHDTDAMLYQLSYEALLEACDVNVNVM